MRRLSGRMMCGALIGAAAVLTATIGPAGATASPPSALPATVTGIADDGPAQLLVALDLGQDRLLARITRKSARALQVAVGERLYAQVKSVAILD